MNTELLQQFAAEINKDWTDGYVATATEDMLTVTYNGQLVATLSINGSIEGIDQDAVDQLSYMYTR